MGYDYRSPSAAAAIIDKQNQINNLNISVNVKNKSPEDKNKDIPILEQAKQNIAREIDAIHTKIDANNTPQKSYLPSFFFI